MSMFCYKEILFQLTHKVDEYKVEGYIEGTFYPENPNKEITPVVGRLITLDKLDFPAFMSLSCWKKIQERKDFTEDKSYYWFIYFHTKRNKEISEVQLIRPKIDKPYLVDFGGEVFNANVDYMRVRGRIKTIFKKSFSIQVECQSHYEKDLFYKPFTLKIDGILPPEANPGEFWDVVGVRNGNIWTLIKAEIADENKLMELKINRREILRNLLLEKTETNLVPKYLRPPINPTQIKKTPPKQSQPKKKKKRKRKPKPKPKIRPIQKNQNTTGKTFRLY
ncbi:hypothetical protein [Crocosphaera chwakensis]|nr:hypothetical protein [Crocosphaera chwakensis]